MMSQNTTTLRLIRKKMKTIQINWTRQICQMSETQQDSVELDDEALCLKEERLRRVQESWQEFVQVER